VTINTYACVSRGKRANPRHVSARHYRPLLQDPNFQIDSLGLRSSSADLVIASATSKGLARPIQAAVPGINWAMPRAPAGLIAWASNRLSCQINRVRNSSGKSLSCAADCSVWHTESKVFVEAEDCARSGSAVAELFVSVSMFCTMRGSKAIAACVPILATVTVGRANTFACAWMRAKKSADAAM